MYSFKTKKSYTDVDIDLKDNCFNKNRFSQYIKAIISVIIFFTMSYLLKQDLEIIIKDIVFSGGTIKGIIAHIQVMIAVYLVMNTINKGYVIAYALNIYGTIMVILSIVFSGVIEALPGVTNYMITLIIITIIYQYRVRLNKQFELLLEQREKLEHMAYYDSLTDIPNRKKIINHLNTLISDPSDNINKVILVFIDMDNFKKVNDTLGHYVGDIVLQMVARRIVEYIHEDDMLGRIGGDEFALIIPRDLNKKEIVEYIEGLSKVLSDRFMFDKKDIFLNASFGISVYPQDGNSPGDLLKCADIAMYKAKNTKSTIEFFSRDVEEGFIEDIELENGLQNAIDREELYLVFQPQYSSQTGSLRGFEVLLRWNSSRLGDVSPAQFIPVAEKTGLIVDIGEWVLSTAMAKFKRIYDYYGLDVILSINISVVQLLEANFVDKVRSILEEIGFDTNRLEFEVTESIFISYPDYITEVLEQLKEMGISISLDDFGTGYASLSYLQNIPIDILKIDKIFTESIIKNSKSIIGPIIDMSHQLGIKVIAEGVEHISQLEYLKKQNCDYIQGYLLGKPVSEDLLDEVIASNVGLNTGN